MVGLTVDGDFFRECAAVLGGRRRSERGLVHGQRAARRKATLQTQRVTVRPFRALAFFGIGGLCFDDSRRPAAVRRRAESSSPTVGRAATSGRRKDTLGAHSWRSGRRTLAAGS
jgi:hypothetical protein